MNKTISKVNTQKGYLPNGREFNIIKDFTADLQGAERLTKKCLAIINCYTKGNVITIAPQNMPDVVSAVYLAVISTPPIKDEYDELPAERKETISRETFELRKEQQLNWFGVNCSNQRKAAKATVQRMIYNMSCNMTIAETAQDYGRCGSSEKDELAEKEVEVLLENLLTEKELQVYNLTSQGYINKEVAEILSESLRTVERLASSYKTKVAEYFKINPKEYYKKKQYAKMKMSMAV